MFCEHCGTKIEKNTAFCQNCGTKIVGFSDSVPIGVINNKALFYSTNWKRLEFFVVAANSYFDILIDKQNLYLIKIRTHNNAGLYTLIGLFVLNVLGALIGYLIGSSGDTKKREQFRSTWVDSNHNLISQDFEKNIFLKIPKSEIKESLVFKKNKLVINYKDIKRKLQKNRKETQRLREYIENHVL